MARTCYLSIDLLIAVISMLLLPFVWIEHSNTNCCLIYLFYFTLDFGNFCDKLLIILSFELSVRRKQTANNSKYGRDIRESNRGTWKSIKTDIAVHRELENKISQKKFQHILTFLPPPSSLSSLGFSQKRLWFIVISKCYLFGEDKLLRNSVEYSRIDLFSWILSSRLIQPKIHKSTYSADHFFNVI